MEVDPLTGTVVARPAPAIWAALRAEQEAWAAQTDTGVSELMERMSIGGSKVVQGAGKAVKFIGKLARKLGSSDSDTQAALAPGWALRAPSSSSLQAAAEEDLQAGPGQQQQQLAPVPAEQPSSGVQAVVAAPDGHIWLAYKRGRVERLTFAGRLVWAREFGTPIQTLCAVGQRVWVGFADGVVSVVDREGTTLKAFTAHAAGIISMVQAGSRTYTLAADGSMSGWSSAVPSPADDQAL